MSQDLSDAEKAKVISERENRLEKKALLKEHLVSSKYNTNLKAIHQHEATDNILLGAIKAKLSILSHSVNNSISN